MGTKAERTYKQCSCGRDFRSSLALERHRRICGCPELSLEDIRESESVWGRAIPTPDVLAAWRSHLGFENAQEPHLGRALGDTAGKVTGWFANALLMSLLTLLYSGFLLGMSWTAISLGTS